MRTYKKYGVVLILLISIFMLTTSVYAGNCPKSPRSDKQHWYPYPEYCDECRKYVGGAYCTYCDDYDFRECDHYQEDDDSGSSYVTCECCWRRL